MSPQPDKVWPVQELRGWRRCAGTGGFEYLVSWENFSKSEDSWEPQAHLTGSLIKDAERLRATTLPHIISKEERIAHPKKKKKKRKKSPGHPPAASTVDGSDYSSSATPAASRVPAEEARRVTNQVVQDDGSVSGEAQDEAFVEQEHEASSVGDASPRVKDSQEVLGEGEAGLEQEASVDRDHQSSDDQLNCLLETALEYSRYIAEGTAGKSSEKSEEKVAMKRKQSGGAGASKKGKTNDGTASGTCAPERGVFEQPKNLAEGCQLKDYQLEGVRWMAALFENGWSGILADEMGLGKTIQCIALIAHLLTKGVKGPFIVVAPLATLPNWVREFEKWLPVRPVVRYHGTGAERAAMRKGQLHYKKKEDDDFPIIVTSYEIARGDRSTLEKLSEFTYMIVDEGHCVKNKECELLSTLKRIKATNRILLTGTPIQNSLDELWTLLNFVNPVLFSDLSMFKSWFDFKDIGRGGTDEKAIVLDERKNQTVSKLHDILRPFLLRRLKSDVLKDMPPKKEVVVYAGISKLQHGYGKLIDDGTLRDTLISQDIESGRDLSQTNKVMNHRKNINHPFLFGEPVDPNTGIHIGTTHPELLVTGSGKFALLDRMLKRLHKDGHRVLIFSQMTSVLSIMEDYLNHRKWKYCRIDGSTKIDDRQEQLDVFNAEESASVKGMRKEVAADRMFVFLLSTRAGGLGINLTAADTCIIFDSDWNPFADDQAMDRCHRFGQTRPVAVYRLITVNSVDTEMMEKQISKKKLERVTIVGGDFRQAGSRSCGEITFEGLKALLQSDVKELRSGDVKDVESIKIDDSEFELIMDRKKLFATGEGAVPKEGDMYSILDAPCGDVLGVINT